jgi:FkbM family methyltransferase
MNLLQGFRNWRYRAFYGLLLDTRYSLVSFGSKEKECAWNVYPDELGPQSIVYSGGVGTDVTFEHDLVRRFGANVVMFDPSPTGLATMALPENQIPNFHFVPVALADHCGHLDLAEPLNPTEGSYFASTGDGPMVKVPCTDLATLMSQHGHHSIDLLKIDIEGEEYAVLDEILAKRLPVRQICVEFHHGILPGITRGQTISFILRLRLRGYRLLDQTGNNHTFYLPTFPQRSHA